MELHDDLTLGIGSCGWAVIREGGGSGEIVAYGRPRIKSGGKNGDCEKCYAGAANG
jgi:hypothetical protein